MTTIDVINKTKAVRLDWYDEGDVVEVFPRDKQRFEVQKDRAIEVLRMAKQAEQFGLQFQLLLNRLALWIRERQAKIGHAIVTFQDDALAFVIVRNAVQYDEDFEDALADLDFSIANDVDLELVNLKTLSLPQASGEAVRSFLDERLILSYQHQTGKKKHGERSGSH